jgi:hypothetical protein
MLANAWTSFLCPPLSREGLSLDEGFPSSKDSNNPLAVELES